VSLPPPLFSPEPPLLFFLEVAEKVPLRGALTTTADDGRVFPALTVFFPKVLAIFFPEVLAVFFLDCDHLQPLLVTIGLSFVMNYLLLLIHMHLKYMP
jgi:hypothetical protein